MSRLLEKLTDGFNLIEGPVWDPAFGLMFSDAVDGGVFALSEAGEVSESVPAPQGHWRYVETLLKRVDRIRTKHRL